MILSNLWPVPLHIALLTSLFFREFRRGIASAPAPYQLCWIAVQWGLGVFWSDSSLHVAARIMNTTIAIVWGWYFGGDGPGKLRRLKSIVLGALTDVQSTVMRRQASEAMS